MKRVSRIVLRITVSVLCAYVMVTITTMWWLQYKYPDQSLSIVPTKITANHTPGSQVDSWIKQSFKNIKYSIPSHWNQIEASDKSVAWGSDAIQVVLHVPNSLNFIRYKRSLYETWNLFGILDRGVLLPRIDPKKPVIYRQQIQKWDVFIFPSENQWHFDLFQNDRHISVVFGLKEKHANSEGLMKDLISTVVFIN